MKHEKGWVHSVNCVSASRVGGVCAAYYHFEQQKEAVDKFVVNETYILTVGVTQI